MKDWVKRRLDRLDDLFPPERLEASKARIRSLWEGRTPADRFPFTYAYALFNMYNALHTPEERLQRSLDEFEIHGRLNDDFIPALFPGCRQSTIPNMFGAPEVVVGDDVSCEQIVRTAEDVERLPDPTIGPGTVARTWLEMEEYFLEETDGRMPVHVTDMQGPLDVCGQLMSYDSLFLMSYDDPDHFRMLLDKATDAFILLWRAQRDLLGDAFVGTHLFGNNWVPESFGASMSIDSLVMYGPDFYREFVAPSIAKVGEAFGAVAVHSCGDFSANVAELCRTPYVSGVNAAQMSVHDLLAAGLDRTTVVIALASYDSIAAGYDLVRSEGLLADLSVQGMPWPAVDGVVVDPDSWSPADRQRLADVEREIEHAARVAP